MKLRILVAGMALGALLVPMSAHAADPCKKGVEGRGTKQVDLPNGDTYYVDDRGSVTGSGTWIYKESNGIPGLQRGGTSDIVPDDTDKCQTLDENGNPYPPDTVIE